MRRSNTNKWLPLFSLTLLGAFATTLAYAIWGDLLQRYSAARVAPFALLTPCTGVVSSALVFGEVFSPVRYLGMALILAGLAVIVFPEASWNAPPNPAG